MWSFVSTWQFSLQAAIIAEEILSAGGTAIDAVERGIHSVESDPDVNSVGRGGLLNERGELELDAAIMDGTSMMTGAVCCVRGFEHPVSIARAVMEKTRHNILAGHGAEEFARSLGISESPFNFLVTEAAKRVWAENREKKILLGHDTIGAIALDQCQKIAVATSTSGSGMKLPGRVGDSPLVGSGFYALSGVGGAAATGLGEDIMRVCACYQAVSLIEAGMKPQKAAEQVVLSAHNTIRKHGGKPSNIALICMSAAGEVAGAANHKGFSYACALEGGAPEVIMVNPIIDTDA